MILLVEAIMQLALSGGLSILTSAGFFAMCLVFVCFAFPCAIAILQGAAVKAQNIETFLTINGRSLDYKTIAYFIETQ